MTVFNKLNIMSEITHDNKKKVKSIYRFHKLVFDSGDSGDGGDSGDSGDVETAALNVSTERFKAIRYT